MPSAEEELTAIEVALGDEFRASIDDAGARIAAVLVPGCPTSAFLVALRHEVERARQDPTSVPYPALADPEVYWDATVRPQSRSMRESAAGIVAWLEQRIITTMEVAEADLKSLVDIAVAEPVPDPAALRLLLEEEIDRRCTRLHHQMAEILTVLPSFEALEEARRSGDEAMHAAAAADVAGLETAYLREAGGDGAHQAFAAQQWTETFADRVAHRCSMLAAQAPWRHQEFALVGFERTRAELELLVAETTARLQAPLREMPQLLMVRYDRAIGEMSGSEPATASGHE